MLLPLSVSDVSLLLAVLSIILLATSEFLHPSSSKVNFILKKKRIKKTAIITSYLFIVSVAIRLFQLLFIV